MGNCFTCKYYLRTPFCSACKFQNFEVIKDMTLECPYYKISLLDRILKFFDKPYKDIEYSSNITGRRK